MRRLAPGERVKSKKTQGLAAIPRFPLDRPELVSLTIAVVVVIIALELGFLLT
jgi:hypothetical protein